ncbi:MAG: hypothetical protein Q4Q06_03055 [Bacteroidota bacterium]|nr:hypothetical protein [Bacteroidota bacterium]
MPTSFIVSKDNKLKLSYYVYKGNKIRVHATNMYEILDKNIEQIDFNNIDSIFLNYEPFYSLN